jgi:NTE family protein
LRAKGIPVVVFRPGAAELAAMSNDFMSRERVDEILRCSFAGASEHASKPGVHTALSSGFVAC